MIRTGGGRRAGFRRGLREHLAGSIGWPIRKPLGRRVNDMLHQGTVEGGYRHKERLITTGRGNHKVARPGKEAASE